MAPRRCPSHRQCWLNAALSLLLLSFQVNAFSPSTLPRQRHTLSPNISGRTVQQRQALSSNARPPLHQTRDSSSSSGGKVPPFSVTLEGSDYSYRDAIQRTLGWVSAAIVFGGGLWAVTGSTTGEEFFAGYLVEQSLSVDNLFVFLLLFEYFKVPVQYQDRVLNWGIYGAIVMRAIMIGLGAAALQNFHAILLVFASILVYSSAKFFIGGDDDEGEDPSQNSIVRFSRNLIHSTDKFDGDRFFTLVDGIKTATPLFICMIAVEISDVVFAVDSIPAVFGVTEVGLVADWWTMPFKSTVDNTKRSPLPNRTHWWCFRPTFLPLWVCGVCTPF